MKKISFLFGSGISLSANLPDVNTITKDLLTKDPFNNNNIDKITDLSQEKIKNYKKFLKKLSNYCIALNLNNTYEDLYYFTESIQKSLCLKEYGDFFVNFFIESIKYDIPKLIDEKKLKENKNDISFSFGQFIFDLNIYIQKFVAYKLQNIGNSEPINRFLNMLLKEEDSNYDLFTLNHDILLETGLIEKPNYNTGFGKNNKFSIDNFKNTSYRFNIFKLHGSINWNRIRDDKGKDHIYITDPDKPADDHLNPTPNFIMGTFNKYEKYTFGIPYDLFHEFRVRLAKIKTLHICGYGFHDQGVNLILLEWMERDSDNEIHIFHEDRNSLIGDSNVFVGWKWEKRIANGQIKIIEKYFEKIEWEEIVNPL
ncbi:MAG: SIR2 family protein [FCB group bacterium]|nr:SIR2 family protein [FCB group bacterium]